jgi:para-nitrobenzyl esterase
MTFKNIIFLSILSMIFISCSKDEEEVKSQKTIICESDRYVKPIFTEVEVSTVKYGSNMNTAGLQQDLMMDIYQPKGDVLEKRPVLVLAFGGSFIAGDRKQLSDLATEMSKLGYVSVCIDYRLLSFNQFPFDSIKALDIAIKASSDMKAAIRHLRKDAATENKYKIDPDFILVGGVSAGAITAIQTAYFDASDNTESHVQTAIALNGGIEGNSGDSDNLKYSSKVQGVINMSGAIYRLPFIDSGEPPIISIHGDADDVVPYGYGVVKVFGFSIIPLFGSSEIEKRSKEVGLKSYFETIIGGGHEDIYTEMSFADEFESFREAAFQFNKEILCQ